MTQEAWIFLVLAAIYAAVGTIEFAADQAAEDRGAYAPDVSGEDPDLLAW